MVTVENVYSHLNKLADVKLAEKWDNVGLMLGDYNNEVNKVLVCLDVTTKVVEEAIANNIDLIVSHHPLIFKPLKSLDFTEDFKSNIIRNLIKNDIAVISFHTNLDSATLGLNDYLARLLNLKDIKVLFEHSLDSTAGLGRIGKLEEPLDMGDFIKYIKEKYADCIIIFITAYDRFDYAIEAMHIKAFDYLLKPWKEERLCELINTAIENVRSMQKTDSIVHSQKDVIKDYIDRNYKKDISAKDVAGILGYSDVYFSKVFKQLFDDNFINYLTKIRIGRAKLLLKDISFNIKEVGKSVGYADSNYFTKVFKRSVGMSPSEYRSKHNA